jgi:hypothetical protein
MQNKKTLGQFYTTNVDYILQGLSYPVDIPLIEPFAGNGDIIRWIGSELLVEAYDIDVKIKNCKKRDTLLNPPVYSGKFVITNPPYLARNKTNNKEVFDKYNIDDLYKAAIISFISGDVSGGILIIPLNFISQSSNKLRKLFFEKYHITKMNIFEEKVFDDTGYTVCSLEFHKGKRVVNKIDAKIFPSNTNINLEISEYDDWTIGKHLFPTIKSEYNIRRLVIGDPIPNNNLFLHAIDGGGFDNMIRLTLNNNHLFGKPTDRSFCSIWSDVPFDDELYIVNEFNRRLKILRDSTNSLFLTNYRESTDVHARKRITFQQAYSLIEQILMDCKNSKFFHFTL